MLPSGAGSGHRPSALRQRRRKLQQQQRNAENPARDLPPLFGRSCRTTLRRGDRRRSRGGGAGGSAAPARDQAHKPDRAADFSHRPAPLPERARSAGRISSRRQGSCAAGSRWAWAWCSRGVGQLDPTPGHHTRPRKPSEKPFSQLARSSRGRPVLVGRGFTDQIPGGQKQHNSIIPL